MVLFLPLSVDMWECELCHHLGTRRGTHHHRGRQSKKVERSGSWWHHGRQHQPAPQPPPPTPRDLGVVRQCVLPATMPGFPVLEAENIVTTLKSRSRCNLIKGAHFVNWLNTRQKVKMFLFNMAFAVSPTNVTKAKVISSLQSANALLPASNFLPPSN